MQTIIQKWGNSLAIRIPKSFASETKIDNGTEVDLLIRNNQLVISPVLKNEYSLDSFLSEITESNIHNEIEFGEPVGEELI